MKTKKHSPSNDGFTRMDLCVLLASGLLLALMVLPAIARTKPRGDLVSCRNNLRQMGMGWISWSSEHRNRIPWHVSLASGGTHGIATPWVHFIMLSNSLPSPAVLVCPSDPVQKPAFEFSADPSVGFMSSNFGNASISYFIGLELEMNEPGILAGDRRFRGLSGRTCGTVRVLATLIQQSGSWDQESHNTGTGNLVFTDGSVQTVDTDGLRNAVMKNPADGNKSGCTLKPIDP